MKKTQAKGVIMLFIAAFVWGMAFVAQSVGADVFPAITFNGIRTFLGAAVLVPVILIRRITDKKKNPLFDDKKYRDNFKMSMLHGIPVGIVLAIASGLQQYAFVDTAAGKVAFITAFYMFFVPLFGMLFGKRTPLVTWGCVLIGVVGLYFLCIGESGFTGINRGDMVSFLCAIGFAFHILFIEKFEPGCDPIVLSFSQFVTAGTLSSIVGFIVEEPTVEGFKAAMIPILYAGILSSGVAFTLQIVGQKYTEATVASLIMCMESVFGVLSSAVVLNERLSKREITGCAIMFVAIIVSQFADKIKIGGKNKNTGNS